MMLPTFDLETKRNGDMHRAAKLAILRHQVVHHIERTDASAEKVEQALAKLAEANAPMDRLARHQ
ncbi:hypothetical protein [Mesorhizobium kowhaii]|uniref:Uncharacterized protein n=1 Tax=Mesorhizobium kowhaii TaxID=1300272 RepID=A0A2W7BRW9_9HYPH|nr:hypothetical protein [Mesorhizobium kowhaii]PZV33382.1 hypothetical protein B5V02_39370 [Mesorhizobium kowhaii]